jgi:hydrogenase expression/formation protein HypC
MCLAIPMKVKKIDGDYGTVELGGVEYRAGFQMLKKAKPGDYVIVHAGFAIQTMSEREAKEVYEILDEMG